MVRSFQDYAAANGVQLASPSPSPFGAIATTQLPAAPPAWATTDEQRLRDELAARLAAAAAPATPSAPVAAATTVPASPGARFIEQAGQLAGGVMDPTVSLPERGLRAAATAAQVPLLAADLPRQAAVAGSGEAFVQDAQRAGPWSLVMTVMGNLGATQSGGMLTAITNPGGIRGRTDLEKQIVPDQFTGPLGSTEDRATAYAAYMATQPSEVQQQAIDKFNQWIQQKRKEYYDDEGVLTRYINFEEWQALNFDTALDVYQNGWQKPAAPIQQPDGTMAPPQINENPRFVGGQAVWEAYVNDLNPVQRMFADISRDPLTPLSFVGGPVEAGLAKAGERIGGPLGRVLTGTGKIANEALNFPSPAPVIKGGRFLAERAAGTRAGAALAGSPAGRGFERVRDQFRQPLIFRDRTSPDAYPAQANLTEEFHGLIPFANRPQTAPGTTVPAGFQPNPAAAARTVAEAQTTGFDEAERAAMRQRQARYTPPPPQSAIGELEPDRKTKYFDYTIDPATNTTSAVRVVRNETTQNGVRYPSYDVQVWNTETGGFDVARSVRVGAGVTKDQARRAAEGEAVAITRRTHDALTESQFTEVGAGLPSGQYLTEWDGEEIFDLAGIANDPRVEQAVASGTIVGQDLDAFRQKLDTLFQQEPVSRSPAETYRLPLSSEELDVVRGMLEAIGERPFQSTFEPPAPTTTPQLGPGTPPIEQAALPTPPPAPTIEQPPRAAGLLSPPAVEGERVAPVEAAPGGLQDTLAVPREAAPEGVAGRLPERPVPAPETTPVTVRMGGEGGVGEGITPATYTHLLDVARQQDPDLAAALERFTGRPGRGRASRIGDLTLDQAARLRSLETTLTPSKSKQADPIRRGLARLYDDLDIATQGQQITPPAAVGPEVAPAPTLPAPTVRRTVAVPTNVRDRVLGSDLPDDLKARFRSAGESRNRGRGQIIDVALSEDDLGLLDALSGHNVKRDVRRVRADFPNAPEAAPDVADDLGPIVPRDQQRGGVVPMIPRTGGMTGAIEAGPTPSAEFPEPRPTIPATPTTTPLAETAARLMDEQGLAQRPLPTERPRVDRTEAAVTGRAPRQTALDEATPTPTQELRHKMLQQQYPDRPIAYDLGDGRFQLLDIDVPSGVSTTAKFSSRKAVPSFTGTREEILANAPNAVFINPREGFRATGADNVVIPPSGRVTDYNVGVWDKLPKNRVSQAPSPTPEGVGEVVAPFRDTLLKAANTLPNNAVIKGQIEDDLQNAADEYISVTRSGYGAAEGDGPGHEVETALTLANRVLDTMEQAFEGTDGLRGMPEFNYGGGRPIQQDPRLDFDAVLRGVFGSSRASKLGTEGFETAEMRAVGGRTAKTTSAGAVMKELTDRAATAAARGNDAEAEQLRGLMGEIDALRQRYLALIDRQTGTDAYSSIIPGGPQLADPLTRAVRGMKELVMGEEQRPVAAIRNPVPDAELIDLMSADAKAASQVTWVNHPEFGNQVENGVTKPGLDSFTVLNEIGNQVRQDQAEYKALIDKGTMMPTPKTIKVNGVKTVSYGKLTPDQSRLKDLYDKYKRVLRLGETVETSDPDVLTTNRFLQEYLREKGMIKENESPTTWLGGLGRWMVGLHYNLGSASGQLALHDPTNFRYLAMNYFGNPALLALSYPRAALRTLFNAGFKTAYARSTAGTLSPVVNILRFQDVATGSEIFAARMGTTVPREVGANEKFAHEKAARGVQELLNRLGLKKSAEIIAEPFNRGARKHIGIEAHQRAAGHWARGEERVAEAWQDHKAAIFAPLLAAGLDDTALKTMERGLPKSFGAFDLHDAVFRAAQIAGKSADESANLASNAYAQWRTPSVRAYRQAVEDVGGALPLNRKTPFDEKLGLLAPFTYWNTRITNYLMQEIYGSPVRMAAFDRYQEWAEDYKRNHPEMPSYLGGYINAMMTPFGVFLAANPAMLILTNAFLDDRVRQDGVNKTMWDEIRDSVGQAIGWSPMPHIQFLAQALGFSRDRGINLPVILPPSLKTFGSFIDWLSAETGGTGGKPLAQDFFTWLSKDINALSIKFLPGAELTSLRDQELARQAPVQAMIIQQHPELLTNWETADAMPPGPEREAALIAASDAVDEAFENENGDIYRDAWEAVAAGKLLTQTINQVTPIRVSAVNPVMPSMQARMAENATLAEQTDAAVAGVEAAAAGAPETIPLGTNATAPGAQPVGVADWRTDPRWANHLTGGPAPDVQASTTDDYLYFANDLIGGTEEFRRIAAVEQRYHSIGTPEERQAYQDHYAIAYGTPMRTVDMGGGRIYNPADILALPAEERKMLADEWIMTHSTLAGQPLVPLIESYRAQRDQFRAQNPEWAAYDQWRDTVQEMVDQGVHPSILEWGRTQAAQNPNFKRVYDDVLYRMETGEYDQDRAESRLKSVGAYLAYQGLQKNVTDPAVVAPASAGGNGSGLTREDVFAMVQAATNSGAAYNPAEAIRQDMQAYSRDLAIADTFIHGLGFQGSWADASDGMKQMAAPLFLQYGVPMPELNRDTQAYLAWAQTHPSGTPEDFFAERQQAQLAVMTGGLPTLATPPASR